MGDIRQAVVIKCDQRRVEIMGYDGRRAKAIGSNEGERKNGRGSWG